MGDDDVELRALRERVYGPDGESASAVEVARLTELEEAARDRRGSPRDAAGVGAPHARRTDAVVPGVAEGAGSGGTSDAALPGTGSPSADGREPADPPVDGIPARSAASLVPPRRPAAWAAAIAFGVVLVAAGFAAGTATAALPGAPTPSATPTVLAPEIAFARTDDDAIAPRLLDGSGIDPDTTRYVAVVHGYRVFLAARSGGDGICIVTFPVDDETQTSTGCKAGGASDGGAVFTVDSGLSIAVGDTSALTIRGTRMQLSETVAAYVVP